MNKFAAFVVIPTLLLATAGTSWSFQPEPQRQNQPRPGRGGGGGGGEGRPEGQPGERRRGGGGGEEMRSAGVESSMKSMNRALKSLTAQIADPAKKTENLQLVTDLQRGAVSAKGAKLGDDMMKNAKDDAAKAAIAIEYRRDMIELVKVLLDVESDLLDDKFDSAKSHLDKAVQMRDDSHKEMGVDEH